MDLNHNTGPPSVNAAVRWGFSPVDWHAHAIDEHVLHPYGIYITCCGHQLLTLTVLYENPTGRICPTCVRWATQGCTPDRIGASSTV
ncbi:MAG: hypothetical protein QOJ58_4576 [Alphaproteobacteria bacterium]|jgi:hypothetical protein|nr:hypothetical protein [Alphaproteobacteria bacterium]